MSTTIKTPSNIAALKEVASQFGTPTYVYFESTIKNRCRALHTNLNGLPYQLLYAMKANSNPALLQIIEKEGFGVDAVSIGEVLLALKCGFAPDKILFSANNMTDAEMHKAHALGVVLNIGESSRLDRFGQSYPGASACIRLNPQIGAGHHEHVVTGGKRSKFGIPTENMDQVKDIVRRHDLKLIGLHQHIGSGILDTKQLRAAIEIMMRTAGQFPDIQFINFGGGIGIPYKADETAIDFDNFSQNIVEPLKNALSDRENVPACWFEPGRFVIAESGFLVTTVNTLKDTDDRAFAGTDTGFNHLLRPILYSAWHEIFNLSNPDGDLSKYDVVGNICESGDLFARDRMIQEINEDDVLAIQDAGAYGMAMASSYNMRPFPAEVLVKEDGSFVVIRRRVTDEELVNQWINETVTI